MQLTEIMCLIGIVFFICIGVLGFIGYQSKPETSVVNEENTTWSELN